MNASGENSIDERTRMVTQQLTARGIQDQRVLHAMASVPREVFVPKPLRAHSYDDSALPIGTGQTISQPYMVARTCELCELNGGERVLEIGTGSGYQAAVLSRLCSEVVSVERIPSLAEGAKAALAEAAFTNVKVVVGDGSLGYPPDAPYDCIVVAAAAPQIPPPLVEQLRDGGRLVVPVGDRGLQRLVVVYKEQGRLSESLYDACVFVPLVGEQGWQMS